MSQLAATGRQHTMTDTSTNPDVTVLGGGLAGLLAAATIAKAGKTVAIYEARSQLGGRGTTDDYEGFHFNQGPHALYLGGPAERALNNLGVTISGGVPSTKGTIVVDGDQHRLPAGPLSLLRTTALTARSKAQFGRLLQRLPKLDAAAFASQTVEEWIATNVSRPDAAAVLEAFVRLTSYTNAPKLMSADAAIHQLQQSLRFGVRYVDYGWQTLVDQLATHPGITIKTNTKATTLPDAKAVIIATGRPDTAEKLLGTSFDLGPAALVATLDLGLNRRPAANVVIGVSTPHYFSNHSAAAALAPAGHYHATVAKYLPNTTNNDHTDRDDDVKLVDVLHYAGLTDSNIVAQRSQSRSTAVSAIPTASRGGMAGRPDITDTGLDNVFIAGDWVGPDGNLLDAAAASATRAASAALSLMSRP